jgi:hypothetical protein
VVVVCVCGGILNCFWQPAGRRKLVSSPGVDGASSLRNSRISLSTGRRACKPAAKPAVPPRRNFTPLCASFARTANGIPVMRPPARGAAKVPRATYWGTGGGGGAGASPKRLYI